MNNDNRTVALEQNNGQLLRMIATQVGIPERFIKDHLDREIEIRYPLPEEVK